MESRSIARLIFKLGSKRRGGGQRHAAAALPPERPPVLVVEGVGWAPGSVWIGTEKRKSPTPTGVQTLDRSACSK